jgi:hypothetical protein
MANVLDLYNRFKGGGNGGKMVYPLENQADYLGKITFTPVEEKPINLVDNNLVDLAKYYVEKAKEDTISAGKKVLKDTWAQLTNAASETPDDTLGTDLLTNQVDAFNGAGTAQSTSVDYKNESLKLNTNSRISLYLPKAIQIQDTVSYDNAFQLGLIGGAIEKGGVGAALGAVASEVIGIKNLFTGGQGMSKEAAGIIAGKVAARIPVVGDAAAGAIRSRTRLTTNPNTRALFKDVPIRNFSFAFQLVPTSRAEARVIDQIIKTFRTELYPDAIVAGGVNIGYKFPNRFLIKVAYNNKEIPGIRFLPVYMQSFNATYNAATAGMHSDGRFTSVDISMAFTETRAIARADVEVGGY